MAKPVFDPNEELKDLFNEIESSQGAPASSPEGMKPGVSSNQGSISFDLKPEELEAYLNRFVVGQEEAIEIIATKVCTHFNRMKLEKTLLPEEMVVGNIKSNILLMGPTGIGKTYIIKLIAKKLGVPFVKADATKFSETGYVGGDVEDLVRELVHEADGDIARAEYGIIYLDEIDKIASSGNLTGPDVSRSGVQRNLLKLMEESEVDLKTPHDLASQVEAAIEAQRTGKVTRRKINTRNILFIVSGAFSGLDRIIKKRLNVQSIGFEGASMAGDTVAASELYRKVITQDLIDYGFESEFVGRLPVVVTLNEVDEEKLFLILKNRHSAVVNSKKLDFRSYGIDVEFTDDALRYFAKDAASQKTGARGLMSAVEKVLVKYEKTMPSLDVKTLVVDKALVENPEGLLAEMMLTDTIRGFQRDMLAQHGIVIEFDADATHAISERARDEKKSIRRLCADLFHDYPYAIKLLKLESFRITADAVRDPQGFIEDCVRRNYREEKPALPEVGTPLS